MLALQSLIQDAFLTVEATSARVGLATRLWIEFADLPGRRDIDATHGFAAATLSAQPRKSF